MPSASTTSPGWFNEGLAIHESGELPWARMKTLWDASFARTLIPLHDLDAGFPSDGYEVNVAYAESADFVAFLMRDADKARFGSLVQRVGAGVAFDRALEDSYGTDVRKLEFQWREEISRRFGILPMLTGGGVIWVLIAALAATAWIRRRRQAKAKLERWAFEEAQVDAPAAAARPYEPAGPEDDLPASRVPPAGVVEHEGAGTRCKSEPEPGFVDESRTRRRHLRPRRLRRRRRRGWSSGGLRLGIHHIFSRP